MIKNRLHKTSSKMQKSENSKESREKKEKINSLKKKPSKERFSFKNDNQIPIDMFKNKEFSEKPNHQSSHPKLNTKRSQPSFNINRQKNIKSFLKKNSVQNLMSSSKPLDFIENIQSVKKTTRTDKNLMRFLGIRESNLMKNTKESFLKADPSLNQMLSQVTQISKLEASQPWDLPSQTEAGESMEALSHFSESHLAESVVTRETKLISAHKPDALLDKLEPLGANRKLPLPDFNRRFSRPRAQPEYNELFNFNKSKNSDITQKKAKLMNEKLDLKYQRLHQKRFPNSKMHHSGNLIEGVLKSQRKNTSDSSFGNSLKFS